MAPANGKPELVEEKIYLLEKNNEELIGSYIYYKNSVRKKMGNLLKTISMHFVGITFWLRKAISK